MKKYLVLILTVFLIFSGCGQSGKETATTKSDLTATNYIYITPSTGCIAQNSKQLFSASTQNVQWSVNSLSPDDYIGSIDQTGLFTAGSKSDYGIISASKGDQRGTAMITIVPKQENCKTANKISNNSNIIGTANKQSKEENDTPPTNKAQEAATDIYKWVAKFNAKLTYEVIGVGELAGYVTHEVNGGFWFTIDYATGALKITPGFATVKISDDVVSCTTTTVNEPFILLTTVNAILKDNNFIFNKGFVTGDHNEGIKMTCLNHSFSDPNASTIQLISDHAFPVTVEAKDGASAPIQGSFTFSGRQATIDGTLTVHKLTD